MKEEEFGGENVEVEVLDDVFPLCEMILEMCKREAKSKEEIMRVLPPAPEQLIDEVIAFLCKFELLKEEEKGKFRTTETGKEFLKLPVEGGDEFNAN